MTVEFSNSQEIAVEEIENVVRLTNSLVRVEYDLSSGKWSFYKENDKVNIHHAFTSVNTSEGTFKTCDSYARSWDMNRVSDALGVGMEVSFICKSEVDLPELTTVITLYKNRSFITVRAGIRNTLGYEFKLLDIYPVRVSFEQKGGLYLGEKTDICQALVTGPYSLSKKYCLVSNSSKRIEDGWSTECSMMNSIWNPTVKAGILAGFITSYQSLNRIFFSCCSKERDYSSKKSFELVARCQYSGFTPSFLDWPAEFQKSAKYEGNEVMFSPESEIFSDTVMISFTDHPLNSLEEYGDNCALINEVNLPEESPAGWCSWYELERSINEEILLKNLDYIAQNLLHYGVSYFQIDDAWQICDGDWIPDSKKFPRGMKWLADQIHSRGLKAGLWVAPLKVDQSSSLFRQHPDWLIKDNSGKPQEVTKGSFGLDSTLPQVQDRLRKLFTMFSREWGYDYFKIDFLNYGLAGNKSDNEITRGKALHRALGIIRESIGKDKFLNVTGPISTAIGLVDGSRLGYDVWASWEGITYWGMGIKPCVRAAAINYYLHNRVFKNDPDCLVMRSPELNLDQVRAWASLIALSGGIVFLSEDLTNLTPERVEIATRILPSYSKVAKPLDLFECEYPGIWHLKVKKSFASWEILGVFNWGYNVGNMEVSFKDLGLELEQSYLIYDFWNELFLGEFSKRISLSVESTSCRVLAIHKKKRRPQVIGTNTHITCGGVDLKDVRWDNKMDRLSGKLKGGIQRTASLYIFVPNNYQFISAGVNCQTYSVNKNTNLLKLTFKSDAHSWIDWRIDFLLRD